MVSSIYGQTDASKKLPRLVAASGSAQARPLPSPTLVRGRTNAKTQKWFVMTLRHSKARAEVPLCPPYTPVVIPRYYRTEKVVVMKRYRFDNGGFGGSLVAYPNTCRYLHKLRPHLAEPTCGSCRCIYKGKSYFISS